MKRYLSGFLLIGFLWGAAAYAADDWTQTSPDPHPSARVAHSMAYAGGDQVLLFAGEDSTSYLDETWVYDLSEERWIQKYPATQPAARRYSAMAHIGGDQVLLFGGGHAGQDDETWLYDLGANTWTQLSPASKPSARYRHAMAYIGGDQVLLFGGHDASGRDDETWVYDLSEANWTQLSPATSPTAREYHDLAYIGSDQLLLYGGTDGAGRDDETWIFDLSETAWTQLNPASNPGEIRSHAMAYIGGDQVLLFGGWEGSHNDETWIFDLGDVTWTQDANATQPAARMTHGLSETSMDGSTSPVLFGGDTAAGHDDQTWTFGGGDHPVIHPPQVSVTYPDGGETVADSVIVAWMASDADPGDSTLLSVDLEFSDNAGASWTVIDTGQANDGTYSWDISGRDDGFNYLVRITVADTSGLSDADTSDAVFTVNNQADDDWTERFPTSAPSARRDHDMAYIGAGQVFLFGGRDQSGDDDESWIYDLVADAWTQQSPATSPSARRDHAMAYIGGDQVLLFGGRDASGYDDETWIYDLSDDAWIQQSPASSPSVRDNHAMAYIGGDQVLLFGGSPQNDETWIYDLSEGDWTQLSPASAPSDRSEHAMAYIGGDQVLLFGGSDVGGRDDETWLFDLSESTWTQQSPATAPSGRTNHAMAYIGADQAMLFGGYDGSSKDDTWIYDLSVDEWVQDGNSSQPTARSAPGLSETSMDGSSFLVLFGGDDADPWYRDDTWTWGGGDYLVSGPHVDVTYPVGGEILANYTTITWIASHSNPGQTALLSVDLEYSATAGTTWAVIDSNQVNDGSHLWDLSGLDDGPNYLVRITVTDTTGMWDYDDSDSLFAIDNDRPQVDLTYPVGGETLADTATITWSGVHEDPGQTPLMLIDLEYSADAGTTWAVIDTGQANDGSHLWDLSGLIDGPNYLVRATATDTVGLWDVDQSDALFTIDNPQPPEVTVIYPNGLETLRDSATITWTATDPDPGQTALLSVDLEYSDNAGGAWAVIDTGLANDGAHFWDLTGLGEGSDYLVRITVTDTTGRAAADTCDALFSIDVPDEDWIERFPVSRPAARERHDLAYIALNQAVLFGGQDSVYTILDDTWIYDLGMNVWTLMSPTASPSARYNHAMAYIGGDQVLLFGGYDGSQDDETWVYDLSDDNWTQVSPASSPSARTYHAMAYIGGDQVLLFGGFVGEGRNGETWVYDLSDGNWTQQSPATSPSERYSHAMAYIGGDQVLLFGGGTADVWDDETWVYDLSDGDWTQANPAVSPVGRNSHAMAYFGGDQVVLFSGDCVLPSHEDETWVYDLSDDVWTEDFNIFHPWARIDFGFCESRMDQAGSLIMFGGNAGLVDGQTWIFGGGDQPVYGPRATVTYPNGGEELSEYATITWMATHSDPGQDASLLMDLDYSLDNGYTWAAIDSSQANDGSYLWDLTALPDSNNCRVRVIAIDTVGLIDFDISDDPFRIDNPDPPQVTVLYPNGGETLADSVTITWTASDPDSGETDLLLVDLEYSENAGGSWASIDSNQVNDGHYFWDISGLSDAIEYLVRITVTDTTGLFGADSSDSVFTIYNPHPPQVTVTYPNGGEGVADSVIITWTATDENTGETALLLVDLDYSDNAGSNWTAIDSGQANDGAHTWDISGVDDGLSYLVRITVTDTIGLFDTDTSDAVFTVYNPDPPQVTLLYPNGGEILTDTVTITWAASDPDSGETVLLLMDLEYSENAGVSWEVIDSGQANDGAYLWDISELYGNDDYLVRITAIDTFGLSTADTSDNVFTIDNPWPRIASIIDVHNDQGQEVVILWDRSFYDDSLYQVITYYSIKRKYPASMKGVLVGTASSRGASKSPGRRPSRQVTRGENAAGSQKDFWEHMGDVVAHFNEGYAFIAPTLWDSSGSDPGFFTFKVTAHTDDPGTFYESDPDSGYSVDDITPAKTQVTVMPGGESKWPRAEGACKSSANTVWLVWEEVTTGEDGSPESGPVSYRVYYDTEPNIAPELGNLLATTTDLNYAHTDRRIGNPAINLYYLVTVIDGSDNESAASNVVGEFDKILNNVK